MAFGRVFCFTFLLASLLSNINLAAVAQNPEKGAPALSPAAPPAAGAPAAVTGAFPDAAAKETTATAETTDAVATPSAPASPAPQLRIGGGDLLNISVYGVPELAQDVRVNNGGDVYLPLIGYVQLAGLTPDQAQSVIENRLREGGFVKSPHVSVFLKEYVNQSATVTGEVMRPGVYPILGRRRLLEVLAAAGGPGPRAGKTVTITHRDQPDEPVKVNLPADLTKSPQDNIEILPGDTLVVNRAGLVYIVGEVQRPAGLVMDNNEKLTVMQAIALVGGPTPVAAMNATKLIRTTASGGREEVPLPLKKMLAAKKADIDLKPDDIIFVPGSLGKKAAKRSLDSVVAVSQSLAIYHP
jgi:polysaccharide biosynthesis/export protein